jgi:hypothetical protein
MTARRDLKRIIRERQEKTRESYTAARVHGLRDRVALLGLEANPTASRVPLRVGAVVLKVNERSARVRILGEEDQVTCRSGDVCDVVAFGAVPRPRSVRADLEHADGDPCPSFESGGSPGERSRGAMPTRTPPATPPSRRRRVIPKARGNSSWRQSAPICAAIGAHAHLGNLMFDRSPERRPASSRCEASFPHPRERQSRRRATFPQDGHVVAKEVLVEFPECPTLADQFVGDGMLCVRERVQTGANPRSSRRGRSSTLRAPCQRRHRDVVRLTGPALASYTTKAARGSPR